MRTHTSQFKEEIKEYGRQFTDKLYYNNNEYDGEHLFSVKYAVDSQLFKSIMQSLTIDTDISMSIGDTLDYGVSLVGTTDEIRFNNFIVNKIEDQKDKQSKLYTCYDNMIKAMVDYETPKVNGVAITYPITIRDYLIAICSHLGLAFKNASDTFTNYDKQVTSEHYVDADSKSLGYTFRDILDDIAEATGSFICINNDGQLEIRSITNTTGKNIFNSTSVVQGYIDSSTSKVSYNTGYRVSTFKIEPNTTYTISKRKNSYNYIGTRQTNTSGTLSNVTNMQDYTTSRVKATITTGANDNYLFIDLGPTNNYYTIRDSIQVELGTEVTSFESYGIDTINEDYFKDKNVNIGKKVGPYNVVVLSRASDSDNIHYPETLPANPIEFKIIDNAILDQDNREDFIQNIYNKINGLEFYLNDFATNGILYYEIGDKYNVSINNVTYTCLMLSDDIKRATGLKENIHTDEPKQSVSEYKYANSTERDSRNAKILVDKANGRIDQIVTAVGDNGVVTTASIVQSINDSGSQIQLNADKIYINGVTFDQNQTMTMTEGTINIQQSSGDNSIYTYEDNSYDNTRTETSLIPAGTYTDIRNMNNDTITDYGEYFVSGIRLGTDANGDTFFVDGASGDTTINGELKLKGGWIASGDLNDVDRSRTCWYGVHTPNQSVANCPDYSNEVGFLNVICWGGNPDWCVQEYYVVTGDRVNKYIRSHHWGTSSNDWSNWKPICVDTGWVDLSSNVNSAEGFAVRPDFPVMARKINDVVYWRGMIYSTTAKNYKMANILLNIPSQFCANYEMGRGGIMYDINTKYYIYQEANYIRVSQEVDFRADPTWYGYNLSTISGYPQL